MTHNTDQNTADTTHFGFEQVSTSEKANKVAGVFDSVAGKYDLMNDLMSFGIHRLWKYFTVELSAIKSGHKVLDLAGGTGDLTKKFSHLVGNDGEVILSDINNSMLAVGRDRLTDETSMNNIRVVQADAQYLPFNDNYFDCVSISFGLRNVTDKDMALRSIFRTLKKGGKLLVLEFSKPNNPLLGKFYDSYSFRVLPKIGRLVTNDEDSYRYLAESIRMHPDQETLKSMIENAGFNRCRYYNMTGGIVALHYAVKM